LMPQGLQQMIARFPAQDRCLHANFVMACPWPEIIPASDIIKIASFPAKSPVCFSGLQVLKRPRLALANILYCRFLSFAGYHRALAFLTYHPLYQVTLAFPYRHIDTLSYCYFHHDSNQNSSNLYHHPEAVPSYP
jgi:hypothetical protein